MRVLAIDSATEACSVALFDGGRLEGHFHAVIGRGHAEQLVPAVAALPGKGRADRILVSLGPGTKALVKCAFDVPSGTLPAAIELRDSPYSRGVSVTLLGGV